VNPEQLKIAAAAKHKENKAFLAKLKQKPPKRLDQTLEEIHDTVFEETDCLACGNCCRTTGPLLLPKDIETLASHLRLKPGQFIEKYLRVDEDGDYVFKAMPCPFLGSDNYCSVYNYRPKACREYPHTNRKKFYQINHLTIHNLAICPAAFEVIERLKRSVNGFG
jgi:Fe-S-cluster containining protein